MRRAVSLLLLTGALAAPASSAAAFPDATFGNQCQYSYDRYWRPVPMIFGGTLTDGAGKELASGTRLAVGDTVRLQGGTVSAVLPSWILPFAYDSGMIGLGGGELPVRGWLALEATNTVEGVVAPIALTTVARTHVEVTASNQVDEERSSIVVVQAPVPAQTWTATGGEVQVRQAVGESLPPIPVGRDGADVRVRGSLFVEASLSGDLKLFMDCLQGDQVAQGSSFTDTLPGTLGVFAVPGWDGVVDGTPVTGPVDADVLLSQAPPRAEVGEGASVSGATLRLRLTEAQRTAWLGGATSFPVTGAVVVHGARSDEATQSVPVSRTITVGSSGPVTVSLPLEASTWTSTGAGGIDLRSDRVISLDAAVGGSTRTLTLTRLAAGDPYPFARLLRSVAPTPIVTPAPTAGAVPTAAAVVPVVPAPGPAPAAVPKPGVASVRSTKLKVAARRVGVSLRCTGATACRGTVRLRTAAKVRVGKRAKRIVTLAGAAKYSVRAGATATVRLTLSRDGRTLLAAHRSVRVSVEVKPSGGTSVRRTLTLKR
ncbi:hypothetical protein OM076_12880 [Solirubrobacter ginsenosidimutans]|uniref:Htaa domain-containing protein n=1 Tax=Solirubrobacter ginsenosidimutans TaxID=490573 RepID=A0A9X3MTW6_9ACTN|nr:hypothetical protein [Solirubrobacter ginsenosidimutans]MDA0161165.1 hypothetical protein [Solirubrobacter ginsenosidimutans]